VVEASGVFEGRAFLVLSWLRGRPMLDVLSARPWDLWRLGIAFGRLHARLHALAPPADLATSPPDAWVGAVTDNHLAATLRSVAVSDTFCHGDFHPTNVMVAPAGVTGVIDFANVMLADRRADLGITEAILLRAPLPPDPLNPLFQRARRLLARAWRSGYRAHHGDFPLTPIFQAWGAAYYLRGLEGAVRDGRGWARQEDADVLRRYIDALQRGAAAQEPR
jgi:Ser/Thr protein kinase RdoA (MazF antagonist)